MPATLETIVKQLEESGIVAPGKLEHFVPPKAHPRSIDELVQELVKQNHLTRFQAQQVAVGKVRFFILGGYTILDRIGAGGMGQVFKAEHRRMKRIVAIKTLPNKTMKDAAAVARFQREVEAAGKLRHPNIVAADDADEANGIHFLVMEYVEGSDLSALVKKNGPFSIAKATNYILQAARGLEFAHSEGVVHRDIKPANLLLDKKGGIKVLDMGLARIATDGETATQAELTGTGAVMGSVDYMAPEQALSTKHADARADIYGLGCSLYYLLTGKPTYDGETVTAKLIAHQGQSIPQLRKKCEGVSAELEAVFTKMVSKKIEDRYQSMSQVIADLEQCPFGQASSVSHQPLSGTTPEESKNKGSALTSLHIQRSPTLGTGAPPRGGNSRSLIYTSVAAVFLGLAILGGIIVSLKTKEGTLVVEVNEPDAMVQVLDAEGRVEVSRKGGIGGKVTIGVDPGKHRLKIEKDGFTIFGQDFELASGGTTEITAKLEAVKVTADAVEANKPWNAPAFQAWMKSVAALPADKQVESVVKKLQDLNPGFDGKKTAKIPNNVVTELLFFTDNVTDISPVRALAGLNVLECAGSDWDKGTLSDISPLLGMKLKSFNCGGTKVADLSSLQGMPLTSLKCNSTRIVNLLPLKGMRLFSFDCSGSPGVSDLTALRGMPLARVACIKTQVSDLAPLEDCKKLKTLTVSLTKVTASSVAALQKALPDCQIEWDDPAKTKVAKPATTIDPDRRAAQWVLMKGGSVVLISGGKRVEAKAINELPDGKFIISHFSLPNIEITKEDAELIKNVGSMNLCSVNLTEQTLISISQLRRLDYLNLSGSHITDQNLKYLEPLSRLRYLLLMDTNKITAVGVDTLQKALPNCKIQWNGKRSTTPPPSK